MITTFMYRLLIKIVQVGNFLGFCPFYVDKNVGKLRMDFWSKVRSIHNWSWLVAYTVIVLPTHLVQLHEMKRLHQFNYTVVILLCSAMGIVLVGDIVWAGDGVCQFLNALYKFLQDFPGRYMKGYDFRKDANRIRMVEFFMLASYIGSVSIGFIMAIHCYLRPESPPYLTFNMDKFYMTRPVHLLASTWFSWFGISVVAVLGAVSFMLPLISKELRLGQPSYKTDDCIRKPHHLVVNWKTLEIFVKFVNIDFGICFVYLQVIFINIILFCNVTLVFQWAELRWNTILFLISILLYAAVGWSIFLIVAGFQYEASRETIHSWKPEYWTSIKDRKYMERVKLSCRPFSFGDGKRYFIRPNTVLRYIQSFSRNTFRALITYGDIMYRNELL